MYERHYYTYVGFCRCFALSCAQPRRRPVGHRQRTETTRLQRFRPAAPTGNTVRVRHVHPRCALLRLVLSELATRNPPLLCTCCVTDPRHSRATIDDTMCNTIAPVVLSPRVFVVAIHGSQNGVKKAEPWSVGCSHRTDEIAIDVCFYVICVYQVRPKSWSKRSARPTDHAVWWESCDLLHDLAHVSCVRSVLHRSFSQHIITTDIGSGLSR